MKVSVNGVEIYYEQTGSGRPLIMVHGNGEDHTIFDKAANVLKDSFTCYLVDSRGHGQSSAVDVLEIWLLIWLGLWRSLILRMLFFMDSVMVE